MYFLVHVVDENRVKVCFLLLLLVERIIQVCLNSGSLFCAVLSKTPFARMSAGAAAGLGSG